MLPGDGDAREGEQVREELLRVRLRRRIAGGELAELHSGPVEEAVDEEARRLGGAIARYGGEDGRALGLEPRAERGDAGGGLALVAAAEELGGGVINDFAFTFLVGILTGTYSSIYIASALVLWWHKGERPKLASSQVAIDNSVAARV